MIASDFDAAVTDDDRNKLTNCPFGVNKHFSMVCFSKLQRVKAHARDLVATTVPVIATTPTPGDIFFSKRHHALSIPPYEVNLG